MRSPITTLLLIVSLSTTALERIADAGGADEPDKKLKVVVFGGHPDDPESGAGGLIATLTRQGHEVICAYGTAYRGGRRFFDRPEAEVRRGEATAACEVLGATPKFFPYAHESLVADEETLNAVSAWLDGAKPDVVVTHWPLDTHPNHHAVSSLVWQCYKRTGGWNLYFFEVMTDQQTVAFDPNLYLDIGPVREVKKRALDEHRSQEPGVIWEAHDRMHRRRGAECGVEAAEAYKLVEAKAGCPLLPVTLLGKKPAGAPAAAKGTDRPPTTTAANRDGHGVPNLDRAVRVGTLRLATCQFPVSADVKANGNWVRTQMRRASDRGADLIHFPECALSGYAGVDLPSVDDLDWEALHRETEAVLALARELKVWVVLGSTHRLGGDHRPHNSLYVVSPEGKIIDRYDKRFCTSSDLKHYSPGDHFVTFDAHGVRCGLLICYDLRFPELYREYSRLGVRLMLHSFYNARQKEGSIHPEIMPVTARAYAGVNNMFVSINNSSAPRSWQSRFITPDGLVVSDLPTDEPGVMVNVVDTHRPYYDASGPFRSDAIRGKLNSGEVVADPRSKDRAGH